MILYQTNLDSPDTLSAFGRGETSEAYARFPVSTIYASPKDLPGRTRMPWHTG